MTAFNRQGEELNPEWMQGDPGYDEPWNQKDNALRAFTPAQRKKIRAIFTAYLEAKTERNG